MAGEVPGPRARRRPLRGLSRRPERPHAVPPLLRQVYLYEYTYSTQGGDGPALYAGNLRRYTGFAYPPALWQYDRDGGFYAADYLRAWFGHAQVVTALRARYGAQWWADKRAGADVRALWRRGVRPEIEDIVREFGATPWDAAALAGYYEGRLAR